jgi:hypothetical protein
MPHDLCIVQVEMFLSLLILAIKLVAIQDLSLKSMNIRSLLNLLGFIDHNSIFLGIKITMSIFCCYKMWLLTIKKLGLKIIHHGVWSLIFKQQYCNNQLGTWILNLISIFYVQHSWVASDDDDFAIFQLLNFNPYPNCIFKVQILFEIQSSLSCKSWSIIWLTI